MPASNKTFIITSVIHFSEKKMLGSLSRSVFSPHERTTQTLNTIRSIREKVPGALVILLEMGQEKDIAPELIRMADKFVFIGKNTFVNWAVNGRFRGLGEAIGLIVAKKDIDTGTEFFLKISGRYFLSDYFRPEDWKGNSFIARKYDKAISTRLYGFSKELFPDWQKALRRSLFHLYKGRSIEDVLPAKFGVEKIAGVKKIGVAGYVAQDGSYLEE